MSDRPALINDVFLLSRRLFTLLGQTNPRYFQAFLHRQIGPRYLSIPKILLCTAGIAVFAPALRAVFPVITFAPLLLLPFAPQPFFPFVRRGQFTIHASEFMPFWILAIAFLITAVRRHLDGERRIIQGEELHSFDQGTPRFFNPEGAARTIKEPLLIFALGVVFSYVALFASFHPAFGAFLMLGALDYAISNFLIDRYWSVRLQDQLDDEMSAAQFQQLRDEALGKRATQFGRPPDGLKDEKPAPFRRAKPRGRR